MKFFERIRQLLNQKTKTPNLFEIKEGSHSRFIDLHEWCEEQKDRAYLLHTLGRARDSNQQVRMHKYKNTKGKPYERK